jgi:cell division protein DivIC
MQYFDKIKSAYSKVPSFLKTKYALVIYLFLIWMTFFDYYNVFTRFQIYGELKEARNKKAYYKKEIQKVKTDLKELFTDEESLEKFAREKYYMKKENEDVILIME